MSGCSGAGSKQDTGRLQPLGLTCYVLSSSPAASVEKIHKLQGNTQYTSKPANQCVSLWFHLCLTLLLWTRVLCCTPLSVGVQLHTSPGSHLCSTHFNGLLRSYTLGLNIVLTNKYVYSYNSPRIVQAASFLGQVVHFAKAEITR